MSIEDQAGAFATYLSEGDYEKDTAAYIDELIADSDGKTKKFLQGLKKFVQEKGFLSPAQRKALAGITQGS
jgi:hypothetical protein